MAKADWDEDVLKEIRALYDEIVRDVDDETVLSRYYAFLSYSVQDRTTFRSFLAGEHERPVQSPLP